MNTTHCVNIVIFCNNGFISVGLLVLHSFYLDILTTYNIFVPHSLIQSVSLYHNDNLYINWISPISLSHTHSLCLFFFLLPLYLSLFSLWISLCLMVFILDGISYLTCIRPLISSRAVKIGYFYSIRPIKLILPISLSHTHSLFSFFSYSLFINPFFLSESLSVSWYLY